MLISAIGYSAGAQALSGPRVLQDPDGLNKAANEINLIIAQKQCRAALRQVQPVIPTEGGQGPRKIDVYA